MFSLNSCRREPVSSRSERTRWPCTESPGRPATSACGSTPTRKTLPACGPRSSASACRWKSLGSPFGDLAAPGTIVQIGLPPRHIDVMTSATGLVFGEAWAGRVTHEAAHLSIPFLGRAELLRNKRATGRPKDLADIHALEHRAGADEPSDDES